MPAMKQGSVAPIAFTTHDSSDNPVDASTLGGSIAVRVIKPSGTSVAGGGTGGIGGKGITQPDSVNALGSCFYTPGATDLNTIGQNIVRISATGIAVREILIDVEAIDRTNGVNMGLSGVRPVPLIIAHAVTGTLTASACSTDLSLPATALQNEAHWLWITGTLAGQVQKIAIFTGGIVTFAQAFTGAPSNGDSAVIINGP